MITHLSKIILELTRLTAQLRTLLENSLIQPARKRSLCDNDCLEEVP